MVIFQITQNQPCISVSQHPPCLSHHYCLPKLSQCCPSWDFHFCPATILLLQNKLCFAPDFPLPLEPNTNSFSCTYGICLDILKNLSPLFTPAPTHTLILLYSLAVTSAWNSYPPDLHIYDSFSSVVYSSMKSSLTTIFKVPKALFSTLSLFLPNCLLSFLHNNYHYLKLSYFFWASLCTNIWVSAPTCQLFENRALHAWFPQHP